MIVKIQKRELERLQAIEAAARAFKELVERAGAANGETTVANTGHLAPYLNGKEVAVGGSLPLGIIEAAEFELLSLTLQPGDRITMMTDGVVEAQNEKRELFGFERTQLMGNQPAAGIAEAAQKFGQQDDITVVSVVRASA